MGTLGSTPAPLPAQHPAQNVTEAGARQGLCRAAALLGMLVRMSKVPGADMHGQLSGRSSSAQWQATQLCDADLMVVWPFHLARLEARTRQN